MLRKTVISSAFQQTVLGELAEIKNEMLLLGPCANFLVDDPSTWNNKKCKDKINAVWDKAVHTAIKALPPSVMSALIDIELLEIDYLLGNERKTDDKNRI